MKPSMRWGTIMGGFVGVMALTGSAWAQSESNAEGYANKYSGTTGSQAVQERMYQERLREIGLDQTQGSQQSQAGQLSQDKQAQSSKATEMESSQRMNQQKETGDAAGQQHMKGSSRGQEQGTDRMKGERH